MVRFLVLVALLATPVGCGDNVPPASRAVTWHRAARTDDVAGCAWASPIEAGGLVVVATGAGTVVAYTPDGEVRWQTALPAPDGDRAWIAATPVVVDGHLVVAWQDAVLGTDARLAHHVAVLDAATGALDPAFPTATLAASRPSADGGTVAFSPATQFSRSTLIAARRAGDTLGVVYVTFGNIQDIQPWHGWVFELDLDRWHTGADPVAAIALTTPETACGPAGQSGSLDDVCGGGIWSPSGPTLVSTGDDYELWVPTGNGQLDLARRDYANSIIRLHRGLIIDPACTACATFDPIDPDPACMASCRDLFIPRLRDGDPALAPPNGLCDGKTFLECYARLDLDLGADSPVELELGGRRLGVLPAKDGAVYLFDGDHFGTMLDRLVLRDFCGTHGGTCTANWAGTMVTRPIVVAIDGAPVVVIPTFYFDATNPAGVVAIEVVDGAGGPTLRERWSAPARDQPEAIERFREHTGRAAIATVHDVPYVVIADPGAEHAATGVLYAIDARSGEIADRGGIDGPGQKYIQPLVLGARVFVTSCDAIADGPTHLEAWDLAE
jgi:hypothetical protein